MKDPQNNDYFPLSEYQSRIGRARDLMNAGGMDAMLLSTEHSVVYFSGFLNGYWICTLHDDVQMVLLSADATREPMLLIPDHLVQTAYTSCISDVRCWSQFSGGASKGSVATVADAFLSLKIHRGVVGAEIGPDDRPGMSFPFFEELKSNLPRVRWVDSTPILKRVTAIKSPLEIDKFRTACGITIQALKVGLDELKTGMSERELGQIISVEMARLSPDVAVGRPWFIFIHASGRGPTAFDGVPTSYRFQKGDEVYIDLGFRFQGYGADMIRCATMGKPSPDTERYYNAGRDCNMAAVNYLKPGIKVKELFAHWAEHVRALGFERSLETFRKHDFDFLGHGIGLSTHELPLLNSRSEEVIEAGMIVAIEGNVFDEMPFTKTRHALKNEENVLVTATGSEWLTPLPNDLYVIEK